MLQYFQEAKAIQQKYTLEDFLFRWRKLQRVIEKQSLEGLLLITGQYALDSNEAAYLFNWLFLGLSGKNIYTNKYLHQNYSQFIVLIHNEQSFIFLPPKAKTTFEHLIYGIPNCRIFCPTDSEYSNKEVLDILKITFFYEMVEKKKSLGLFLEEEADPKSIEKWPIIQSYALQPVGKTFFTLQHKVVNLSSKISTLFKNLDKHSLKNLVSQTLFSMQGQIKGALSIIELKSRKERKNILEKEIQQSLQQAVQIGSFESGDKKQVDLQQRVKVLFGSHTSDKNAESSNEAKVQSNHHLTIQHYDPYTEFQVWRTYFLNTNLQNQLETKIKTESESDSFLTKTAYVFENLANPHFSTQKTLILMYLALVQGTIDVISAVSRDYRNLNLDFLRENILNKINQTSTQLYGKPNFAAQDLQISLQSFDSFGQPRPIDFKDVVTFKLTSTFYVIKCKLNNLTSPETKQNLGSVVFSECFLLQEGCFLLLSKNISYFDFWNCQQDMNQLMQNLNPNYSLDQLGKPISEIPLKNRVFVPLQKLSSYHFNVPILDVKYYFHEKGIRIFSSKIGWKIIYYKDIEDLTLVNKIPGEWVLFRLKEPFLFEALESNVLLIEFRGKAFEVLLKKINSKEDPLKLNYLQEIPPILSENWYFTEEVLKKQIKKGALVHQCQILQPDFLWSFIEAKQLMILNMKDIKMNSFKALYQQRSEKKVQTSQNVGDKHHIILVTGTYGSNKLKLAQTISKFGPSSHKYSTFSIPFENLYSRVEPSAYIQLLEEYINDNSISLNSNHIVLAIVPSWLDASKVIPLLLEKFYIRTIISKVNSTNFYSNKNKNLVENVLTFCLPGYAQNVILDSTGDDDESLLSSISKILWVFNSEAKISRASNGIISSGQCSDIVKDESYSSEHNEFLRNKYSAFFKFQLLNALSVNYLEFKFPIFNLNFTKQLTKTNGFLINYASILNQLKDKRAEAENSKDELMLTLYQLEESITILKRRQKLPQIKEMKGVVHFKDEKGDREFAWTNKDYRQKTIEEGSKQRGFFILSQNFDQSEVRKFFDTYTYKKILFQGIKEKLTVEKLSEEQRKAIERQNRNKYLQNGDYFDGYFYRNIEGFILPEHPHLHRIVSEWVEEKNKEIQSHNSQIRKEWEEYAKKYEAA